MMPLRHDATLRCFRATPDMVPDGTRMLRYAKRVDEAPLRFFCHA